MSYPFILGTAQFGSHYGVVNSDGCPSDEEVKLILETIIENGVNFLDTAFSYGNSLDRIAFLSPHKEIQKAQLINKFNVSGDLEKTYSKLLEYLKKTGLKRFYGLLIHDLQNLTPTLEKDVCAFLKKVKDEGIVYKVGVSVYSPSDLKGALDTLPIDLIQCPINLFDQRFLADDVLRLLKDRNIEIHARSLFLQGILLSEEMPQSLKNLQSTWNLYRNALLEARSTSLQFILSWIKSIQGIDKWVIGINKKHELSEILAGYDESLSNPAYNWAKFNIPHNPDIDPRNWEMK